MVHGRCCIRIFHIVADRNSGKVSGNPIICIDHVCSDFIGVTLRHNRVDTERCRYLGITFGPTLSRPEETQMIGAYGVFFLFLFWIGRRHLLARRRQGPGVELIVDCRR